MVDLPAPFWPTSAMISPGSTSSDAAESACTPWKRLLMSRMARSGSAISRFQLLRGPAQNAPSRRRLAKWEGQFTSRPFLPARTLVGVRQGLLSVAGVVEVVGIDDHRRDLVTVGVVVKNLERRRTEARVALAGATKLAVDDRLDGVLLAVDRDDQDDLARDLAGSFDRCDRAKRHFVVMRVDDGCVGVRLQ